MPFATDAFAGTAGTELSAYSAVWSKQSGFTTNALIGNDGQYAYTNAADFNAVYQHSAAPASADYSVFADIAKRSGVQALGPLMGVIGRAAAAAATFYAVYYDHATTAYRLSKLVAGTQTLLGSDYIHTLTTTPENLELRMAASSISVYVDGVLRIGPVTDTDITAAGKSGIWVFAMRETGIADAGSLDNFSAENAGGGGGSTLLAKLNHFMRA
jgi:hypothetical protein